MTTSIKNVEETKLLRVSNLTVEFDMDHGDKIRAVNDVSFDVAAGRVLGIVGESGSGKSVTARSILRTLRAPGRIVGGEVEFQGQNLIELPEKQMREVRGKDIAMVFQDPQAALNPVMQIGEQIAEALLVHGSRKEEARARAVELLGQVGIPDPNEAVHRYPHQFSGGMRQRVVIAIALANRPRLLIADEPTTALDVTIQAQILKLLMTLREQLGIAVIMITHDMGVIAEFCDDMLVMYAGRIVERGTVSSVFGNPRHPYTASLLKAIPRISDEQGRRLLSIPGSPPDLSALPKGCAFHPRCPLAIDKCRTEVPPVFAFAPGRSSACWVSGESGGLISIPDSEESALAPRRIGPVVLQVSNLRTDVSSTRRGLLSRHHPVFAVDDVSIEVRAGETVGLVGESGCGKSTLARTIVGISKPTSGRIDVMGEDVTLMSSTERRGVARSLQYVFQDPFASLNPRRTIGQSLEEALSIAGIRGQVAQVRAETLMSMVGLNPTYLDRYPYAFSGGQRQRVGIARALAADPKILILDEPVSALDVSIQAQIIDLLEKLRADLGLGYLFIAHDLAVVRHLSDRVAVMYLGRIVEYGTADQIYDRPQHPYTAALISSTPEPDLGGTKRTRIVLQGDMPSPASPPSGCSFRTRCPTGPKFFPERTQCITEQPQLKLTPSGQTAACHFAGELDGIGVGV